MTKRKSKFRKRFIRSFTAFCLAAVLALSGWAGSAASVSAAEQTHSVRSGESWWSIANRYGVNYHELARHNGRTASQTIYVGQTLRIPGTGAPTPAPTPPPSSGERTHTVVWGESWWSIGNRYGVNYNTLARHNGRTASQTLFVGRF